MESGLSAVREPRCLTSSSIHLGSDLNDFLVDVLLYSGYRLGCAAGA